MNGLNHGATTPAEGSSVAEFTRRLDGFETRLVEQRYVLASVRAKIGLATAFVAWIQRHDVSLDILSDEYADRFLRDYRRAGARRGDAWTVLQFLGYLRIIPSAVAAVESTAVRHLVLEFGDFLCKERASRLRR